MFTMNAQSHTQIPTLSSKDAAEFLRNYHNADSWVSLFEKYGSVMALSQKRKLFAVSDPQAIAHILKDPHDVFDKNFSIYNRMKFLLGDGLLTRTGDVWRERRKLVQPHFTHHVMPEVAAITIEKTREMIVRWQDYARKREIIHLNNELLALVLQISSQALLHCALDYSETLSLVKTFAKTHADLRNAASLNPWWPSLSQWRGRFRLCKIKKFVKKILQAHVPNTPNDMVDTLLSQLRCPFSRFTQRDVEEEMRTFLGAGHETNASGLIWTIVNLLQHPNYLACAQHELSTLFSGRDPCYDDIESLVFTKMVWQESLRLYPPIWMTGRHLTKSSQLLDYDLPQDSTLFVCLYALHRNQQYWPDPNVFNPYRFTREAIAARDKFAYLPFGSGGHVCIAQLFATTQAQLILAMILKQFDIELLSADLSHELLFTIHPKYPVYVRVKER